MAGASDKARFYLEQSVPELHELLRRKLFSEQEVTSIAKTRSDFEHKLNARGSRPSDFARYAEFEINLEALRRKRIKRKGLRNSGYTGQRRIFFVLDRATKRFSGDLGLWMQYIEFTRQQKANKKLSQILTTVLRLHPTNPELWIYAAIYALDEMSDIIEAREFMQRGLRFCKQSKAIWREYTKLEMMYISRLNSRGRILGLHRQDENQAEDNVNLITFPQINVDESGSEIFGHFDKEILQKLQKTPALSGAIPNAIFDAAMKQFPSDTKLGRELFDIVAAFQGVPCTAKILDHIVQSLQRMASSDLSTMSCFFREPTLSVETGSAEFPSVLRLSLDRLKICRQTLATLSSSANSARSDSFLARETIEWSLGLLVNDNLDPDVATVLLAILKKTWCQLVTDLETSPAINSNQLSRLIDALHKQNFDSLVASGVKAGLGIWPGDPRIEAFRRTATGNDQAESLVIRP